METPRRILGKSLINRSHNLMLIIIVLNCINSNLIANIRFSVRFFLLSTQCWRHDSCKIHVTTLSNKDLSLSASFFAI